MSRRAEKSTQAMQRGTATHYETHPFEFMTEDDDARIEALQPAPFRQFVNRYLRAGDAVASALHRADADERPPHFSH